MADTYGTDIAALDDLPDPEVLVTGETNVAYACARRCLTTSGALEEIGDPEPYDSFDVRDYLAARVPVGVQNIVGATARQVVAADERVASATASATADAGSLSIPVAAQGTDGPFDFVLTVDGVSASLLRGGA